MEIISEVPAPGSLVTSSGTDASRPITRSARLRNQTRPQSASALASHGARVSPHRHATASVRRSDAHRLLRTSLPLLFASSLMILIPACWSLGYFADLPVWKHDDPKAAQIASALIVTWPMAIILVSTATYFWTRRNGV